MTAARSGIRLTQADAAIIKGMIARGDRQHDIAAYFGVNGGRIAEISKGATFAGVPKTTNPLPPAGPYLTPVAMNAMRTRLKNARNLISSALPIKASSEAAIQTALSDIDSAIADLKKK